MLCSPAWDCASTHIPGFTPWELNNLLPLLTNCWDKLGSYRCFHLHFTLSLWLSEDQVIPCQQQHHSSGPASLCEPRNSSVTPHRSSPWPSNAQEGEKHSSAHDAAAHSASLSNT